MNKMGNEEGGESKSAMRLDFDCDGPDGSK